MVDKGTPRVRAKVRHLRWAQHHNDGAVEWEHGRGRLWGPILGVEVSQRPRLEFLVAYARGAPAETVECVQRRRLDSFMWR